jgi:hypothetical protein
MVETERPLPSGYRCGGHPLLDWQRLADAQFDLFDALGRNSHVGSRSATINRRLKF